MMMAENIKKRRRNKKSKSVLPEEIIFNILVLLPARTLHNKMRYVCKQWYNIIRDPIFINQHLLLQQYSRRCLLIKLHREQKKTAALIMEKSDKEGYVIERVRLPIPIYNRVHGTSCDGLILFSDHDRLISNGTLYVLNLYVLNPVTGQHLSLPRLDLEIGLFSCCLIKSRVHGDYKVVCRCRTLKNQLTIVTVGKSNAWSRISTETLCSDDQHTLMSTMIDVEGFVHWFNWRKPGYVVTLDVDSESLSRSPVPEELKKDKFYFKSTGNFLSLLIEQPSCNGLHWHVWRFVDCKKGVWTKLYDIKFEPQRHMPHIVPAAHQKILVGPLGWVDNGDVLLLNCRLLEGEMDFDYYGAKNESIAYNVRTGEATTIVLKLKRDLLGTMAVLSAHVNSLVPLEPN